MSPPEIVKVVIMENAQPGQQTVIIGGGISGLASAYYIQKNSKVPNSPILLETGSYWGGKIITERTDGFIIEARYPGLCLE